MQQESAHTAASAKKKNPQQQKRSRVVLALIFTLFGLSLAGTTLWYFLPVSLIPNHTSTERPANKYQYENLFEQTANPAKQSRNPIIQAAAPSKQDTGRKDILDAALKYVATAPKYKSAYYAQGRPDDGYGVCTDVVDQALLAVGIDLQQRINEDYALSPESYPQIKQPDVNIDFRRVVNQKVWLQRHAKSLTTDVSQIQQWLPGDIVVFKNHVGIVSDRRMRDGIPYLVHHDSIWQRAYEDDVLQRRSDIIGHFRLAERK